MPAEPGVVLGWGGAWSPSFLPALPQFCHNTGNHVAELSWSYCAIVFSGGRQSTPSRGQPPQEIFGTAHGPRLILTSFGPVSFVFHPLVPKIKKGQVLGFPCHTWWPSPMLLLSYHRDNVIRHGNGTDCTIHTHQPTTTSSIGKCHTR